MASGDVSRYKFATGTSTSDGDYGTPLVAAVSGKKIRVLGFVASVLTTAGTVTLKSSTTSTIFAHHLALGVPLVVGFTGVPVCETVSGEALTPSNGTGVDSFCTVTYVEVDA